MKTGVRSHHSHSFTISSAPDDSYISVHVRQAGDWTYALGERLGCTRELAAQLTNEVKQGGGLEKSRLTMQPNGFIDVSAASRLPVMRIDGPYGAPAEDVFKSECVCLPLLKGEPALMRLRVAILIGTGIGVTPWGSVLKVRSHAPSSLCTPSYDAQNIMCAGWLVTCDATELTRPAGTCRRKGSWAPCDESSSSGSTAIHRRLVSFRGRFDVHRADMLTEWFADMLRELESMQTDPDFLRCAQLLFFLRAR